MLPPNATSIMQPLDQGIILTAKRRYKKKLAERYLACVENNKDANSLLKTLDIVQATNMIAASWRETSTIIQNCFCKAGPPEEETLPALAPDVWNRVQRWLGDVQFDEFVLVNLKQPQHSLCQMKTLCILFLPKMMFKRSLMMNLREKSHLLVQSKPMIDQQKAFLK